MARSAVQTGRMLPQALGTLGIAINKHKMDTIGKTLWTNYSINRHTRAVLDANSFKPTQLSKQLAQGCYIDIAAVIKHSYGQIRNIRVQHDVPTTTHLMILHTSLLLALPSFKLVNP